MWTTPPFDELKATLEDASSPIGKRMRAAYYCKQLFWDGTKENTTDENDGPSIAPPSNQNSDILNLLCTQLMNRKHGSLMRHEFAYVLGQMQSTDACPTLENILEIDDDCVMVRHEAAEALGAIASETSIPALKSTYEKYTGLLDELADTCLLALNRIENPLAQVGCACMLAPYSSVDPVQADPQHAPLSTKQLGDMLCDANLNLVERYRAMFSLRDRGGEESVEQLCRALLEDESSPLLRHEVAFVLGQLQHPSSIQALEASLGRSSEHVMVRHESAEALGAIDVTSSAQWQRIEDTLTKFQQDAVPAVAESCIVALDAADYWGHTNAADDDETSSVLSDVDEIAATASGASNFGQQKRMDEHARKTVLAQHFNVAIQ